MTWARTAAATTNTVQECEITGIIPEAVRQDPYVAYCARIWGARVTAHLAAVQRLRAAEAAHADAVHDWCGSRTTNDHLRQAERLLGNAIEAEGLANYWVHLGQHGYQEAVTSRLRVSR